MNPVWCITYKPLITGFHGFQQSAGLAVWNVRMEKAVKNVVLTQLGVKNETSALVSSAFKLSTQHLLLYMSTYLWLKGRDHCYGGLN